MASWMVHLRIADKLLDKIPGLCPVEFIVGNIAPDSGVPNADWSSFTPSTQISHFRKDSGEKLGKQIHISAYVRKYFSAEKRRTYNKRQNAFYLGYLVHLITDTLWADRIAMPSFRKYIGENAASNDPFIWTIKEDWYDLDFKYLRDYPGFRAFRVYLGAVGFVNEFMDEFSADAFDNRRQYITGFYLEGKEGLDREYPYLTEAEMDAFVNNGVAEILAQLKTVYDVQI